MGEDIDEAYARRLETLPLDPGLIRRASSFKIVFTPTARRGRVIIKPMLTAPRIPAAHRRRAGSAGWPLPDREVAKPENPEALSMAIALANETNSDLVIATDPDDDRMGIAARDSEGNMELLTGNQIGSLIAWYRAKKHFDLGILNDSNKSRGVIIKTFVTTDLQKAIAEKVWPALRGDAHRL